MGVSRCCIVSLPTKLDARGALTIIEGGRDVPFDIARVYYLHDVPSGECRGAHAHRQLWQLMVAMSGEVTVTLDDGLDRRTFLLRSPREGLLVCPMIWRSLQGFSPGAVCMVLASDHYDESDYFRSYDQFVEASRK